MKKAALDNALAEAVDSYQDGSDYALLRALGAVGVAPSDTWKAADAIIFGGKTLRRCRHLTMEHLRPMVELEGAQLLALIAEGEKQSWSLQEVLIAVAKVAEISVPDNRTLRPYGPVQQV